MNWTPEPWRTVWIERNKRTHVGDYVLWSSGEMPLIMGGAARSGRARLAQANADRAIECVNALAGIADPAGFMTGIANVLREIEREGTAIQFEQDKWPEHHARRIKQLVRAAAQSMGEAYYNVKEVQEPALSEPNP
jgi:hypothetical protein